MTSQVLLKTFLLESPKAHRNQTASHGSWNRTEMPQRALMILSPMAAVQIYLVTTLETLMTDPMQSPESLSTAEEASWMRGQIWKNMPSRN